MAKKTKRMLSFDIKTAYNDDCKEYKSVILDGKEIYQGDMTKYMGHMVNMIPMIISALSAVLKREVTREEFNTAFKVGAISE